MRHCVNPEHPHFARSLLLSLQLSIGALLSASTGFRITSAVEMTATGGVPLASLKPVSYFVDGRVNPVVMPQVPAAPYGPGLNVSVSPMQVRTFLCKVASTTSFGDEKRAASSSSG